MSIWRIHILLVKCHTTHVIYNTSNTNILLLISVRRYASNIHFLASCLLIKLLNNITIMLIFLKLREGTHLVVSDKSRENKITTWNLYLRENRISYETSTYLSSTKKFANWAIYFIVVNINSTQFEKIKIFNGDQNLSTERSKIFPRREMCINSNLVLRTINDSPLHVKGKKKFLWVFHDSLIHKRGNLCSWRQLQFGGDCSLARYIYSISNILVRSATRTFTRILAHASLRTSRVLCKYVHAVCRPDN